MPKKAMYYEAVRYAIRWKRYRVSYSKKEGHTAFGSGVSQVASSVLEAEED